MNTRSILRRGWPLLALLALCLLMLPLLALTGTGSKEDDPLRNGSPIETAPLSDVQADSLYRLCKVWGLAKYHHPSVVSGELNWDAELISVMPDVLRAQSADEANAVLLRWLEQFPISVQSDEMAAQWHTLQAERGLIAADTAWTTDVSLWGSALSEHLTRMAQVSIADRSRACAFMDEQVGRVTFENERAYPAPTRDMGMYLLGLFRFWNAYAYYSPNLSITVKDWDDVLRESIPRVAAATDHRSYVLAIAQTVAMTADAHAAVYDSTQLLRYFYGKRSLPCSIRMIDGQAVVHQVGGPDSPLRPGDVLQSIDGDTIAARIEALRPYTALPEPDKLLVKMGDALLAAQGEQAEVVVLRGEQTLTLHVSTLAARFNENREPNGLMADGRVGYIDPSALAEGDVEKLMAQFSGTQGIIVDLRYYPSVFLPYLLGEYIVPSVTVFAVMGMPNHAIPGAYWRQEMPVGKGVMEALGDTRTFEPYTGKVVLLMDESSVSQSEFTIMALRQAPNAVVVGSPSLGADGDIGILTLPGRLQIPISGLGVYTPDGGQTQRVGLTPDVPCLPTVEGLREGRDELIEQAIEIILS